MTQNSDSREPRAALLEAILDHVPFDGWTAAAFDAAIADTGIDPVLARALCPRGAVDLAVDQHRAGDAAMRAAMESAETGALRYRDKVALAVRLRIEAAGDREVVRRASALFALPHLAPTGARLIWETADAIWDVLGDNSDDINWYTKRATLSGVYASTVLYWLGDTSEGQAATWAFLDRRINDVMQIEKIKARLRDNPLARRFGDGPGRLLAGVRKPDPAARRNLPGRWHGTK